MRLLAVFLAALPLAAPAARAQTPLVGWTKVERTTRDSGGGQAPDVRTTRTVTAGARSRTETFEGGDSAAATMIMITDSAAGTLLSVMPAQKMAMLMNYPGDNMKAIAEMVKSKPVGLPVYKAEDLGDGPVILGHPTHHYRTTVHTVLHFEGSTFACDNATDSNSEIWTTLDSIGPREPRRARPARTGPLMPSVVPELDSTAMANRVRVRGRPLRTESEITTTRGQSSPVRVKTLDETTELRYGPVDSTLFAAPAGYKVRDMRAMMASVDMKKMFEAMGPMTGEQFCGPATSK